MSFAGQRHIVFDCVVLELCSVGCWVTSYRIWLCGDFSSVRQSAVPRHVLFMCAVLGLG
jgi:hypothetical protein